MSVSISFSRNLVWNLRLIKLDYQISLIPSSAWLSFSLCLSFQSFAVISHSFGHSPVLSLSLSHFLPHYPSSSLSISHSSLYTHVLLHPLPLHPSTPPSLSPCPSLPHIQNNNTHLQPLFEKSWNGRRRKNLLWRRWIICHREKCRVMVTSLTVPKQKWLDIFQKINFLDAIEKILESIDIETSYQRDHRRRHWKPPMKHFSRLTSFWNSELNSLPLSCEPIMLPLRSVFKIRHF